MNKIAFLFSGQGSHFVGMAKDLFDGYQEVKELYLKASKIAGFDIAKLSFEGPEEELNKTSNNQLAIVIHSVAVLEVLRREVGLEKLSIVATAGLSLGEYTALYFAGALSFKNLVELIRFRGYWMQEACNKNPGTMAAVIGLDHSALQEMCDETFNLGAIAVANHLLKNQIIISGARTAVDHVSRLAKEKGAKVIKLNVAGAYHSELMREAYLTMKLLIAKTYFSDPEIPFLSNVTGDYVSESYWIKENLKKQMISPVYWRQSMEKIKHFDEFWELGPGEVLTGLMKKIAPSKKAISLSNWEDIEKVIKS